MHIFGWFTKYVSTNTVNVRHTFFGTILNWHMGTAVVPRYVKFLLSFAKHCNLQPLVVRMKFGEDEFNSYSYNASNYTIQYDNVDCNWIQSTPQMLLWTLQNQ